MSFDGIRIARVGLVVGWVLISMLVVAGFAGFSADEGSQGDTAPGVNVRPGLGHTAGAVAALAFVGSADTTSSTIGVFGFDGDPTATGAGELGLSPTAPRATTAPDTRGGVYVRSGYLEETEMRVLVSAFFQAADVNRAIRVAWCESSFNPSAVNPASGASGLFQHLPEHWAERSKAAGHPGASIFDPEANVAVAAWMLYELPGGWSHWDCSP
jgi:hypothetical protein